MILFEEVRKGLSTYLKENSDYKPLTTTIVSTDKYPKVVISKADDRESKSDTFRRNVISDLVFEIDIYAKDKVIGNKTISSRIIATELENLIKRYMGDMCGFKRTLDKPTPNIDTTIYRVTMRYSASYNDKRNVFL